MAEQESTARLLMVIGAHAGDVECMAGAAVLRHTRAGHPAVVVHLTLGEAGHPGMDADLYAEQRKQEIDESGRLMGAEVVSFEHADGMLEATEELKLEVCDLIRIHRPAVILTHWKGSIHRDHVATYQIVQDAVFYAALPAVKRLRPDGTGLMPAHRVERLYYPENWEDMDGWHADLYLDVAPVWEDYLAVLRSHELMRGGISRFRYYDYYSALGITRGCLAGVERAVGLMAPEHSLVRTVAGF